MLSDFRGEDSIADLCRGEGIAQGRCYCWSKEFLEACKMRLAGDTVRQVNSGEVKDLRAEALALKELVADLTLENTRSKKHERGGGRRFCTACPEYQSQLATSGHGALFIVAAAL